MEMDVSVNKPFSISAKTFCSYQLTTEHKDIVLNFPQLLALRNKINEFTQPNSLYAIINNENFVLLFIADRKHVLYVDVPQLLALKEALDACFLVSSNSLV